ncbi:MAG TPA: bifunctional nuclease domain-containing protein, partial [Dehalococcoidales bacterium]|nr:bifunctional nuclease domain-containing protein [Dehalococcoidales bacterium]
MTGMLPAAKTDAELVTLARSGDKDAFGQLAERYQMMAQRLATRFIGSGDGAQDLAQEAMLQAYLSLGGLRNPARFKSWLYGIMLNVYRSRLRDRKIAFFSLEAIMEGLTFFPTPFSAPVLTPEKLAEEKEQYQTVLNAVNALSPADRNIIFLFYYAQLSLQEIVSLTNIPMSSVKVRLHRAREKLKTVLQEKYPDIIPPEKRRKPMVKVSIADVIKTELREGQELLISHCVVILHDVAGRRLLPIWVGPPEGEAIAIGLSDLAFPRPLTHRFYSSLLQGIGARLVEARVVALKKDTFYGVAKIKCGKKMTEIDARPSDAIALAVLNDAPIFVAEEVFDAAGANIPKTITGTPNRKGLRKIIDEIGERQRQD